VRAAREAWFESQPDLDPERLVFLDETAATTSMVRRYGWAPRGARCRIAAPAGHWKTTTVIAGLRTSGPEAIALLESTSDVAIVLMDIMMPEMDGYQTMEVIRKKAEFRRLPIIALTAKAMKGDREKCLEAGASDYLAKPVNTEQLLSALRMWLHR